MECTFNFTHILAIVKRKAMFSNSIANYFDLSWSMRWFIFGIMFTNNLLTQTLLTLKHHKDKRTDILVGLNLCFLSNDVMWTTSGRLQVLCRKFRRAKCFLYYCKFKCTYSLVAKINRELRNNGSSNFYSEGIVLPNVFRFYFVCVKWLVAHMELRFIF